jgi:hypothetical protein
LDDGAFDSAEERLSSTMNRLNNLVYDAVAGNVADRLDLGHGSLTKRIAYVANSIPHASLPRRGWSTAISATVGLMPVNPRKGGGAVWPLLLL